MKSIRRISIALLVTVLTFTFVPAAFAHPLGNFTINQYVGLHLSPNLIRMDYVVDMAEIPTFQELAPFDANHDRQPEDSPAFQRYPDEKCATLLSQLNLTLSDQPVTFTLASSSLDLPIGVGALPTLRLTCEFQASLDATQTNLTLSFTNNALTDRIGWTEVVLYAEDTSAQGEFATTSLSNRLTNYPEDLLTSPLDVRSLEATVTLTGVTSPAQTVSTSTQPAPPTVDRNDAFTRLILMEEITLPALLLALGISFVWGAAHAMTPGHGKTIVGAYLVGSRGTIKHALYLGLTTTITHTLGVFALGAITLFAAQYIVPETLFPWLSLLSGLLVVGLGINMFAERFKSSGIGEWFTKLKPTHAQLEPAYSSIVIQEKSGKHNHRFVMTSHGHSHKDDHHHHDHEAHDHHHGYHGHSHGEHSHMPPEQITWRSLLALGISGGLIPCPSALVVMLGAIALNRIGLGLVLVLAFSLGLAGALTAIGITFIYAGRLFERFPTQAKVVQLLPVFSALFVSALGVAILVKALGELGVV